MKDYGWILTETVRVELSAPGVVTVMRLAAYDRAVLEYRDGELLIDGAWYEVGDDLPCLLGLIDEATERGSFVAEPYADQEA